MSSCSIHGRSEPLKKSIDSLLFAAYASRPDYNKKLESIKPMLFWPNHTTIAFPSLNDPKDYMISHSLSHSIEAVVIIFCKKTFSRARIQSSRH